MQDIQSASLDILKVVDKFCKENYMQLSIDSDASDTIEMMRAKAASEEDWLKDVGVSPVRIKYNMRSESPFENIALTVRDLMEKQGYEHRKAVESAVRLYTIESAQLAGFSSVGGLRLGESASFLILSKDIFSENIETIAGIKPEAVYIDGRIIYGQA